MCGVIVVDAGRSRSTNLGRDAYILIISLDIVITIRFSIKCPTLICLPTMCYFLREATSEIYAPGSILYHFCFTIYYLPLRYIFIRFYFQIYYSKNPKIPCCNLLLFILSRVPARSIYPIYYNFTYVFTREGLTTPLLRRVASICSLCVGVVYVVLHGSPTGSMTLVSSLRKYLPLLCCIIPSSFGKYRRSSSRINN